MTNGDKIRARTDEEIARDIVSAIDIYSDNPCYNCPYDNAVEHKCGATYYHAKTCYEAILRWLKEEAEED